jgi:hypothetical protein
MKGGQKFFQGLAAVLGWRADPVDFGSIARGKNQRFGQDALVAQSACGLPGFQGAERDALTEADACRLMIKSNELNLHYETPSRYAIYFQGQRRHLAACFAA